jgi:hypothetical protein
LFESYYKILFFILMNKQTNKVKGKALIRWETNPLIRDWSV